MGGGTTFGLPPARQAAYDAREDAPWLSVEKPETLTSEEVQEEKERRIALYEFRYEKYHSTKSIFEKED